MLVSGYRSSRVWRIQMAHLAFHTCFCNFCGQSGKNTIDSAEKYKKRKNKLKDMRLCKRWRRPISKRFIKPPYSISRAASIDSDCCRLPTTSVLSKMGHPRVVVAPFARRHLWCIWAAVSVGSQCVVARFAREHLWGNYAAISVGSQCVVARFARRHLRGICAAVSVGSQCVVDRFAHRHLTGI